MLLAQMSLIEFVDIAVFFFSFGTRLGSLSTLHLHGKDVKSSLSSNYITRNHVMPVKTILKQKCTLPNGRHLEQILSQRTLTLQLLPRF